MPDAIGRIIDSGAANTGSDAKGFAGDSQRTSQPEIITGTDFIEPDTFRLNTAGTGSEPRRTRAGRIDRRTRAGRTAAGDTTTATASTEEKEQIHLSRLNLEDLLFSVHLTLSEFTHVPELEIDRKEAEDLSGAVKEFSKFYGVTFDPKKVAVFNLCLALGKIYVPRAIAVKRRVEKQRTAQPQIVKPAAAQTRQKPNGAPAPPVEISLANMSPSELWPAEAPIPGVEDNT